MILVQAQLLESVPRRSSVITVTTDSRLAQLTAHTSRLHSPPTDTRANRWLIKTRKVRTPDSSLPLLMLLPIWPLPSSMEPHKTRAHSGEARHIQAQMETSHGIRARRSLMTSPRTSVRRCLSRTQNSNPLPPARTRRAMRNSRNSRLGHPVPGSSKTSPLVKHRRRVMVLRRAFLTEAQCHRTPLSSNSNSTSTSNNSSSSNRTIRLGSCPARIWAVLPVRWSIHYQVVGRVRTSIRKARPLFQGLPQTTRHSSHLHPRDHRLVRTVPSPMACHIH